MATYQELIKNSKNDEVLAQAFLSMKKYAQTHSGALLQELATSQKENKTVKHHLAQWDREKKPTANTVKKCWL